MISLLSRWESVTPLGPPDRQTDRPSAPRCSPPRRACTPSWTTCTASATCLAAPAPPPGPPRPPPPPTPRRSTSAPTAPTNHPAPWPSPVSTSWPFLPFSWDQKEGVTEHAEEKMAHPHYLFTFGVSFQAFPAWGLPRPWTRWPRRLARSRVRCRECRERRTPTWRCTWTTTIFGRNFTASARKWSSPRAEGRRKCFIFYFSLS